MEMSWASLCNRVQTWRYCMLGGQPRAFSLRKNRSMRRIVPYQNKGIWGSWLSADLNSLAAPFSNRYAFIPSGLSSSILIAAMMDYSNEGAGKLPKAGKPPHRRSSWGQRHFPLRFIEAPAVGEEPSWSPNPESNHLGFTPYGNHWQRWILLDSGASDDLSRRVWPRQPASSIDVARMSQRPGYSSTTPISGFLFHLSASFWN